MEKKFVAGLNADFMPILGNAKGFFEAENTIDYLLATVGMVAGPLGDALKAMRKMEKTVPDLGPAVSTKGDAVKSVDDSKNFGMPVQVFPGKKGGELDQAKIDAILSTTKGGRPDPSTYLTSDFVQSHLAQFNGGVTKFSSAAPTALWVPLAGHL